MENAKGIDPDDLLTHLDWLGALARHLVVDQDRAKDLVQEACVVALRKRPTDPSGVRAWLGQVVRNLHRQRVRSEGNARSREVIALRTDASEATDQIAERVALQRELARLVLQLEEPGRSVILLRYYSGLLPREIADRLGVSVPVVNGRLQRALARLRSRFGAESNWSLAALGILFLEPPATALPNPPDLLHIGASTLAAGTAVTSAIKTGIGAAVVLALGISAWLVLPTKPDRLINAAPHWSRGASSDAPSPLLPSTGSERKPLDTPTHTVAIEDSEAGAHVAIFITDTDRKPISGAVVEVTGPEPRGTYSGDKEGLCSVPIQRGTGSLELRVSAIGFVPENQRVSGAERVHVVLRRAADVHGRVVTAEDGSVLSGAQVTLLEFGPNSPAPLETMTDGAGRFELHGVPLEQPRWWRVRAEGFAILLREIDVRDPSVEIELPITRAVPLGLLVVDALTGEPIQGASIRSKHTTFETDEDGRLDTSGFLSITEQQAELIVSAPSYCSLYAVVRTPELQPGVPVQLPLLAGVHLDVHLIDAMGEPVRGAFIKVSENLQARRSLVDGQDAVELVDLPKGWVIPEFAQPTNSFTDSEGRIEMIGLEPLNRWYRVRARGEDNWLTDWQDVPELGPPGSITRIELELPPPATCVITGTMTLNNQPVAGSIKWRGSSRSGSLMVGPDGTYRIEGLESGRTTFSPNPDGKIAFSRCSELLAGPWFVDVDPGKEVRYDIAMELEMASVSGQVVDASGKPQAGVAVQARSDDGCWRSLEYSDLDGRFELSVRAGPWAYTLTAGDYPDIARQTITAGAHGVELILPGAGRLKLRVVDRSTRAPLSGFALHLQHGLGGQLVLQDAMDSAFAPDPQGWFEVKLQPGAWHVFVFDDIDAASGYLPLDGGTVLVQAGNEHTVVELERERGFELDLRLADGQSCWPSTTSVFLLESDRVADLKPSVNGWAIGPGFRGLEVVDARQVKPDSNGRARVISLRPGACRFVVFPDTIVIEPEEIVVDGTESAPVEIRWTRR
jgi:RNA polymerase sigma factor (sigma-70 family)